MSTLVAILSCIGVAVSVLFVFALALCKMIAKVDEKELEEHE